jgi:hypothetical protein
VRNLGITELTEAEFFEGYETESLERSRFLPDSRSDWEPIRTWEASEPPPMRWVIADLIPDGYPASLFGDGATGKSYMALIMAAHVSIGLPFLGRDVLAGPVLYADGELDEAEFLRRSFRVSRGMGLERPPEGLYYLPLRESLANPQALDKCAALISRINPMMTILDSFNAAAHGADTNSAADVTTLMRGITTWGTTLIIDHIPKAAPGANLSTVRAHGSVFKYNLVRSAISAVRADGGAITLRQTKSNFGPTAPPTYAALEFEPYAVRLETIGVDDERLAGAERHLSAAEQVLFELHERGIAGATPQQIGEKLRIAPKTVRNYLSKLRKEGRVQPIDGDRWHVPDPNTSD